MAWGIFFAGLSMLGMCALAIIGMNMDEERPASEEMAPEATALRKAA